MQFSIFVCFLFRFLLLLEKECTFPHFHKSISSLSIPQQNDKSFAQKLSFENRALKCIRKAFVKKKCLKSKNVERLKRKNVFGKRLSSI